MPHGHAFRAAARARKFAATGLMPCPECNAKGGGFGPDAEWSDCPCCHGKGSVTAKRLAEFRHEIDEIDAECMRQAQAAGWA